VSQPAADGPALAGARSRLQGGLPVSVTTAFGALALVPTAGVLFFRLVRNLPVGLPAVARGASPAVEALAAVVPALAMVGLAIVAERRAMRVSFAAVGVFALLGAADGAAWLPAAAATLSGAAIVLALDLRERLPDGVEPLSKAGLRRISGPAVVAGLGLVALATSLTASAGIETTSLRPAGTLLVFATLAVLPLVRSLDDYFDLGLWVVATFAIVVGAASAPFVAGAVVLVALGAGTAPLALLAMGLGGGFATVVADTRRTAYGPAVGAALVLVAGVPATLPRAVAFALGLVILVREWDGTTDAVAKSTTTAAGGVADA